MAKKEEKKSIWEQMKDAWKSVWADYCTEWTKLWGSYKSIILPFIKGTCAYIWQLFAGLLKVFATGVYKCGKIIYEYIVEIIKRA